MKIREKRIRLIFTMARIVFVFILNDDEIYDVYTLLKLIECLVNAG